MVSVPVSEEEARQQAPAWPVIGKGEARADWNASFRNWMTHPLRQQEHVRGSPFPAHGPPRKNTPLDFLAVETGEPP